MRLAHFGNADLAHLVERNLAKVEVAGSSPVIRSSKATSSTDVALFIRRHGQVVRHRSATPLLLSSNLSGASKKSSNPIGLLNFLSNPKEWHVITPLGVYVICAPRSMASRASVYFPQSLRIDNIHGVAVITYATSSQLHTACGGFHTRLWRDLDAKGANYGKKSFT